MTIVYILINYRTQLRNRVSVSTRIVYDIGIAVKKNNEDHKDLFGNGHFWIFCMQWLQTSCSCSCSYKHIAHPDVRIRLEFVTNYWHCRLISDRCGDSVNHRLEMTLTSMLRCVKVFQMLLSLKRPSFLSMFPHCTPIFLSTPVKTNALSMNFERQWWKFVKYWKQWLPSLMNCIRIVPRLLHNCALKCERIDSIQPCFVNSLLNSFNGKCLSQWKWNVWSIISPISSFVLSRRYREKWGVINVVFIHSSSWNVSSTAMARNTIREVSYPGFTLTM